MSGRRRILVVDDDADVLALLKRQIETTLGHDVVTTAHPTEVLGIVRAERPDLIVCDIDMDERPGGEVASDLAGDEVAREVPFLFLSSLVKKEDVDSDGTVGGLWMISKASPMNEILARIEEILGDA